MGVIVNKIDLTIVCCYNNCDQLQNDLLKSLNEQNVSCEKILIDNRDNKFKSAAAALNYGASQVKTKYVLFSHQDISFTDKNALNQIYNYMVKYNDSLIGVAGAKWDDEGTYTTIVHGYNKKSAGKHKIKKPVKVTALDECLFGMSIETYQKLLFDEKNFDNWHLYAADISYNATCKGIDVYAVPSKVWHNSQGQLNHSFFVGLKRLRNKYGDEFNPVRTPVASLTRDENVYFKEFRVLHWNNSIFKKKIFSKFSNLFLSHSNQFRYYRFYYHKVNKLNKSLKKKNKSLTKKNKRLKKDLSFINFDEFLINSYVSPVVKAPFSGYDKRCFAFMDHLAKYLSNLSSNVDKKPLVSVIMPTYNREDRVLIAINSVLNQTYSNFELIIVDDASTDETVDILNSFNDDRIKVIIHDENKGVSASRNSALKEAKGEYIAYLDSDNEWTPNYLSSMVGAFLTINNADALYSGQLVFREFNSSIYAVRFGSFNKSLLHNRNYIDLNCFCHKREVVDKVGGFDETLLKLVDWDFILKISEHFNIYSVPVLECKYYDHSDPSRVTLALRDTGITYEEIKDKVLEKNKICNQFDFPLKRKVSVIIPSFEALNELSECVDSILSSNEDLIDIIIVDNNSGNDVVSYLKSLEKEGKAKIILNNINYGFTYAVNQGIELADKDSDIFILNNDAVIINNAIGNLQNFAYNNEDCAIAVPHEILINNKSKMRMHVPYADKDYECDVTPSKKHHNIINMPLFHDGGTLELNFAPFFGCYIKREVYDKTLGLDAELGRHYRSDRIFSDYVRHILNMKIYQCPDAFIYHKHQVSTNKLKEQESDFQYMFKKNQWEPELAEKLGYSKRFWDD